MMDKKCCKFGETIFIDGSFEEYYKNMKNKQPGCKRSDAQKYWGMSAELCWAK